MEIVPFTEMVMNKKTMKVQTVNEGVREIAEKMVEAMRKANGIGLAANQVGHPLQIAIVDTSFGPVTLINPKIVFQSGEMQLEERCLSAPGFSRKMKRAWKVRVRYTNVEGEERIQTFEGVEAACAQHEIDHLNGVTIATKF
jgi:peptide deformylase